MNYDPGKTILKVSEFMAKLFILITLLLNKKWLS